MKLDFSGRHFEKEIILMGVRWYVSYPLSYRDVEELMEERGVEVDHSTLNRWVIKYAPELEANFSKNHKKRVGTSWRMDETYIKVKGDWYYLYRAVDKEGATIDFMLSKKRDKKAARKFFIKSIGNNGVPEKVTIDKSGSNKAALNDINLILTMLFLNNYLFFEINIRQIKYLNNIVEQDHRFIKKIVRPMLGFKSFDSAEATLAGIELNHMLKKSQHINASNMTIFEQFYVLAG
jgi:putative transposase